MKKNRNNRGKKTESPHLQWEDEKKDARVMIGFICLIWLAFLVANLIKEKPEASVYSGEFQTVLPYATKENVRTGEYGREADAYLLEHFVNSDKRKGITLKLERVFRNREFGDVYVGNDGYLFKRLLPQDYEGLEQGAISKMQSFLAEFPEAVIAPIPTKEAIESDKLPLFAPNYRQDLFCKKVSETLEAENYLDIYSLLKEHKKEDLYYKTDNHLTMLATLHIYDYWLSGKSYPPRNYDRDTMFVITSDFRGNLCRPEIPTDVTDSLMILPKTTIRDIDVSYDGGEKWKTMYSKTKLVSGYAYDYYLDGNHGLTEIDTSYSAQGRELILIKDSYANELVPLLVPYYKKIYIIDVNNCPFDINLYVKMHIHKKTEILWMESVTGILEKGDR